MLTEEMLLGSTAGMYVCVGVGVGVGVRMVKGWQVVVIHKFVLRLFCSDLS